MPTSTSDGQSSDTLHRRAVNAGRRPDAEKRSNRACLHCRQRKSKCDLFSDGIPGQPPCVRCVKEQHECIIGGSRRGGARIRKKPATSLGLVQPSSIILESNYDESAGFDDDVSGTNEPRRIDQRIASTDLRNTSDALNFLAHVADRAANEDQPSHTTQTTQVSPVQNQLLTDTMQIRHRSTLSFPLVQKGQITANDVQHLLERYQKYYHNFFPIADRATFDPNEINRISDNEPHLLTAILTVASKDDEAWRNIHDICSLHMQQLISVLAYSGAADVEAVEALLILAEWVPRRFQAPDAVGRGEEDQAAWMLVGTALRLGYLQGLDRTAFRTEKESRTQDLSRRRLAWAACYISDRQISVRIGRGFWSRGPGPMAAFRSQDFPSLRPQKPSDDDNAMIFQANLELTQLFSNAHDVLYAPEGPRKYRIVSGDYVKYIDDFRVAIRHWHNEWGTLSCSANLKSSLALSYDYLRLYVNAFAYQATMSRAAATSRSNGSPSSFNVASTPDARFIYEAIDAAKSLLSTFNSYVDPITCLRYMPLKFYLYVIYSAVFLYKAKSTGIMGNETRGGVRRLVNDTIDRLQKGSSSSSDLGCRYSRLLLLLWRKPLDHQTREIARRQEDMPSQQTASMATNMDAQNSSLESFNPVLSPYAFSWLDLEAVGQFATTNNTVIDNMFENTELQSPLNMASFDAALVGDLYQWPTTTNSEFLF